MRDSRSRLAKFDPATLTADQRRLYDSIISSRTARPQSFSIADDSGGLEGPFNAMLLQPDLGFALQALGAAIRFDGALNDRAREIAILIVAATWDSEFEQFAHEAVGRGVGLSPAELTALRSGNIAVFTDPEERTVAEVAFELAVQSDLSDESFAAAVSMLGHGLVFELTTLVGYYATLALQLRVFRVKSPGHAGTLDNGQPSSDDGGIGEYTFH